MVIRLLGVLVAFLVSCLVAALTMVLFVLTPSEIAGLPPDVRADRVTKAIELAGFAAAQFALFSTPFALVAAAIGEILRNRNWTYYVLAGLVIAGLGFFAQQSTEQAGQPTIANNYALTAFLTSGLVGGFFYWLIRGRFAGGRRAEPVTQPTPAHPATAISVAKPQEAAAPRSTGDSATAAEPHSPERPAGHLPSKA